MVTQTQNIRTSVQVTVKTRERLIALGKKGDKYEDIIKRALDVYEKQLNK